MNQVSVWVVSDLHGAPEALKEAVADGATLVLLGDLINFIDYTTMTGILADVFSVDAVRSVLDLRARGELEEARRVMRERAAGREEEIREQITQRVRDQYIDIFAALPDPTYLILGNVDNPVLARALGEGNPALRWVDGTVVEIEGERFGFVGGALPTPLHVAGEITEEELRAKIEGLGDCDVLCTHIPPAVPELCYDTLARHHEQGSKDLLTYIEDVQPRVAYFGHVHQPLVSAMHLRRTLCVNVGYFRATGRAFPHIRRVDG